MLKRLSINRGEFELSGEDRVYRAASIIQRGLSLSSGRDYDRVTPAILHGTGLPRSQENATP